MESAAAALVLAALVLAALVLAAVVLAVSAVVSAAVAAAVAVLAVLAVLVIVEVAEGGGSAVLLRAGLSLWVSGCLSDVVRCRGSAIQSRSADVCCWR